MGNVVNFKGLTNWTEMFDIAYDCLTFLLEESQIMPEMVIKTAYDILTMQLRI